MRLVTILLALLVAQGLGHAQPPPVNNGGAAVEWIRPEEVPARAYALRGQLEAAQPGESAKANVAQIERGLDELDPVLNVDLDEATRALARSASLLDLADLQRRLTDAVAPLGPWGDTLETEANRVGKALDDVAQTRHIWLQTRSRPEVAEAEASVGRSVQRSIEALDKAVASLKAWRARVLAVSDRLTDRREGVDAMIDRLRVAQVDGRRNLFVRRAPLWNRAFGAQLRSELPRAPEEILSYSAATRAYVEQNPRPLVVQVLLAALLMFGFRRLSVRARERLGQEELSRTARLLERPYALGLLLILLAAPMINPLAPRRFMQLLGIVALLPIARIVIHATEHANATAFAGLFVVALLDRLTLALAPLPGVAGVSFLLFLATAFGLAFWFKRRIRRTGAAPWLRRTANFLMLSLALALLAQLGGWSTLATLFGRGILTSTYAALALYAAAVTLEPLLVSVLTSPTLRRSDLFERNKNVLPLRVERWLPRLVVVLWLYLALRAAGLSNSANDALRALLRTGVSVGALSLTIGGVLAFVLTLLSALILARVINEVLNEAVYPHSNLPRGVPDILSTLVRYGVYTLGFLFALAAVGIPLSQLSILLGGFGVGIGLGLQDIVKNFAAGLTLLTERSVHVGDVLQMPSLGIFGHVRSIGMRATIVRSWDGSEVVVPNGDLVSSAVTNWTLSDRLRRIEVPVGVAHGTDPEHVVALLLDVARSNNHMRTDPAPQVLFKAFGDSSLDFVLRAWTDEDYDRTAALTSDLALAVHRRLLEAGISK